MAIDDSYLNDVTLGDTSTNIKFWLKGGSKPTTVAWDPKKLALLVDGGKVNLPHFTKMDITNDTEAQMVQGQVHWKANETLFPCIPCSLLDSTGKGSYDILKWQQDIYTDFDSYLV